MRLSSLSLNTTALLKNFTTKQGVFLTKQGEFDFTNLLYFDWCSSINYQVNINFDLCIFIQVYYFIRASELDLT